MNADVSNMYSKLCLYSAFCKVKEQDKIIKDKVDTLRELSQGLNKRQELEPEQGRNWNQTWFCK